MSDNMTWVLQKICPLAANEISEANNSKSEWPTVTKMYILYLYIEYPWRMPLNFKTGRYSANNGVWYKYAQAC